MWLNVDDNVIDRIYDIINFTSKYLYFKEA